MSEVDQIHTAWRSDKPQFLYFNLVEIKYVLQSTSAYMFVKPSETTTKNH